MRTHTMQVRLTKTQGERLKILAEGAGFNTVSSYVRFMLFNPTFEMKLNRILEILKELKK
ncbi:MAG: hypothetical protein KKF48_02910 [Nanoarchaeota archaeon]|nr:hypothetical protein [Nanoarchaeota archaeon]MBU1027973.1 hypothetical protein [Nanoarchaeota archaeon]